MPVKNSQHVAAKQQSAPTLTPSFCQKDTKHSTPSRYYARPALAGVRIGKLTSPFVIYAVVEGHDDTFSVLDVVVIQDGPAKNQTYLEDDGQVYTENFTPEVIHELAEALEGVGLEVYTVEGHNGEKQFVHPSSEINRQTPTGLVSHQVGFLKNLWVDTKSHAGKLLLRAKAYLNDGQLSQDLRAAIRTAFEQGARYIPAPSINGMMLWSPQRRNNKNFFDASRVLSMRSVEFVSRPAAGGAIYAVIEGERMNFLDLFKQYCKRFAIAGNFDAETSEAFISSIAQPNDVVSKVVAAFGDTQDESAAMAILAEAALSAGAEDTGTEEVGLDVQESPVVTLPEAPVVETPAAPVSQPPVAPPATPETPSAATPPVEIPASAPAATPDPGIAAQALQQMQSLGTIARKNASFVQDQTQVNKVILDYIASTQQERQRDTMVSMVTEAVNKGLPVHRKAYWSQLVSTGQIKDAATLKSFLDADLMTEGAHEKEVMENFRELPVSTRRLAGISVPLDEADISHLRAKMLFQVPCTESQRKQVTARGIRGYRSLDDMYQDLCPGDPNYTGMAFGGGRKFEQWKSRLVMKQATEGTTAGDEVVTSSDFASIFLQVVGELGLHRWEILDKAPLDLCEVGPNFENYVDSNVVVHGSAPDMELATESGGYPELETGARQSVTTRATKYGGIMRWSEDVIIDNRMDLINQDVLSQVDATWRAVIRKIVNTLMGWTSTGINTDTMDDDCGVLYQAPGTANGDKRRNYVSGDGRDYNTLVALVNYMMQQEDIAKAGQTPQPLTLMPGKVLCEKTAWSIMDDNFTQRYKPGTENESNKLRQPDGQTPQVIGVHQSFLHGRSDFVCVLPNPLIHGVVRYQTFRGLTSPQIIWQNAPDVGRVFENGELAVKFRFPVRVTLLRPKGAYAAFQ